MTESFSEQNESKIKEYLKTYVEDAPGILPQPRIKKLKSPFMGVQVLSPLDEAELWNMADDSEREASEYNEYLNRVKQLH